MVNVSESKSNILCKIFPNIAYINIQNGSISKTLVFCFHFVCMVNEYINFIDGNDDNGNIIIS